MRTMSWRVLGGALILAAAACGGGGDSNPVGPGGGSAAFSAKIDGQDWAADANAVTVAKGSNSVPGSLTITGSHIVSPTNYTSIILTVGYITGPGDYPLGVNYISTAGGIAQIVEQAGVGVEPRITPFSGAAGLLTITSLTSSRIAGTFSFTAGPSLGSGVTGSRSVTNGSFDLALPAGFTAAPADNYGSLVRATVGGMAWNAATIVAQGSNGVVGFTAGTDSLMATMISLMAITPGSYSLGTGGAFTLTFIHSGTAESWGGKPTDAGTVVITSFANGRLKGSFSGTLQPGAAGGGALTVTGGTFDLKVNGP